MPRNFPDGFKPESWDGVSAQAYAHSRGDAFEALVEDGFFTELGKQVHAGGDGKDGGIDIWIEGGPAMSTLFDGPYPAIIQCKHHNENRSELAEAGWKKVMNGLREAQKRGWTGLEEPWLRAKSYVHCVSIPLTEAARQELAKQIASDLRSLMTPDRNRLKLPVSVVTWMELQAWLNHFGRVCDRWLGAGFRDVIPRAEFLDQFKDDDFRKWLNPDKLPFVTPPDGERFHPERLMQVLESRVGRGGVILHGPGGVGKTRTAVQVGALAEKAGWRVLHVNASEKGITAETLLQETALFDETTLVVYDYLDQASNFDPAKFAHRLPMEYPGSRIVLLGTARRQRFTGIRSTFDVVPMNPDERHLEQICAAIRKTVGPDLDALLGPSIVAELTGRRPIIALLILEELKRRASSGKVDLASIRNAASLADWLDGRLVDLDALVDGGTLAPLRTAARTAAAAVLMASPQPQWDLIEVAAITLRRLEVPVADLLAERVVTELCGLGWLVPHHGEFVAVHDVVTDDVVEALIVDPNGGGVYEKLLDVILTAATVSSRTLGRMALAVSRLLGDQLRTKDAEPHLRRAITQWFESHADDITAMLHSVQDEDGRDTAAYAIGAVLSGSPWGRPLLSRWNSLVAPWIETQKTAPEIRHVLYRALQMVTSSSDLQRSLMRQANDWFAANYLRREASYLAVQIVEHADIPEIEVIEEKLKIWLLQNGHSEEGRHVITAVLRREELSADLRRVACDAAERWLETQPLDGGAPGIARLLAKYAPPTQRGRAFERLVHIHYDRVVASNGRDLQSLRFVLEVVRGHELEPMVAERAIAALDGNLATSEAARLLGLLLGLYDIGEARGRILRQSIDWPSLEQNVADRAFLFECLLERHDLSEQEDEEIVRAAMAWIASHRISAEAGTVLGKLLRHDLGSHEPEVVRLAAKWLAVNSDVVEAGCVLPPLLRSPSLGDRARDIASTALSWIGQYMRSPEAHYTIEEIVMKKDLDERLQERLTRLALDRFISLKHARGTSYVGKWLAQHINLLNPRHRQRFFAAALSWVQSHSSDSDVEYVANALLRQVEINNGDWLSVARVALQILRRRAPDRADDWVFTSLSNRCSLLDESELRWLRERVRAHRGDLKPIVRTRINRMRVTDETLRAALTAPVKPLERFAIDAVDVISDGTRFGLIQRYFRLLPALVFALSERLENRAIAEKIVAVLRNDYVSGCDRRQVAVFRQECLDALALIPEQDRPDFDAAMARSGASEQRAVLRIALEGAVKAPADAADVVMEAIRTIDADLRAGAHVAAGHLLARVLPVVARIGDAGLTAGCIALVREVRDRSNVSDHEIFLKRCRALLSKPCGLDVDEMLAMFQVTDVGVLEARLNRLVSTDAESVPPELAAAALGEARQRLAHGLSGASFLIEPLLVLAVRLKNAELIDTTCELTRELLPLLSNAAREGFTRWVYGRLVSPWNEYGERRAILQRIPLAEPVDALVESADLQLRASGVAPSVMVLEIMSELGAYMRAGNYVVAGILMKQLLPLSASGNGGVISPAVARLATALLNAMPPKVRNDFVRHAYHAFEEGAWGDIRTGERELQRLGITTTEDNRVVELLLRELIADPARAVDAETLRSGLDLAAKRIDDGRIAAAGYLLVPLLALASRLGDAEFKEELHEFVTSGYLTSATKYSRDGFRRGLHTLLDKEAWLPVTEGELLLAKLGISVRHTVHLVAIPGPISADDVVIGIETVTKMLDRGHADDAALGIAPVLAAAARCDDEKVRHQALRVLQRFLDSPVTRSEDLDRVTKECREMVAKGTWGPAENAERAVEEMAIAPVRLETLASTPHLPISRDVVTKGVRLTETIIAGPWPRRANDYIANLLPLTERIGDAALASEVDSIVEEMLRRYPSTQSLLLRRCERTLAAWPDAEAAAARLRRLGIVRG